MTKHLQTIKRKMFADLEVRAGLTQAEVAERMGTTQSVVARLESGARMPSVNTLLKFAKAIHSRPIIKLLAT